MLTRRQFGTGLGASALALALSSCGPSRRERTPYSAYLVSPKLVSPKGVSPKGVGKEEGAVWGVSVVHLGKGTETFIPVGFRGHSVVCHPSDPERAILFPQRPGRTAAEIQLAEARVVETFDAAEDRHFYGHGCLSAQREALFCAENDPETGLGAITVRDERTHRVLSEFPSFGIGPHDMKILADGRTLLVGNGGLHTRPDVKGGYRALNKGDIQGSLAFVDIHSGKLLEKVEVGVPELSLRHHCVDGDDVYIGLQFARKPIAGVSLVARYERGAGELEFFEMPDAVYREIHGQTLSLDSVDNRLLVMTHSNGKPSPVLTVWDIPNRRHLTSLDLGVPSGVALAPGGREFLVTAGDGRVRSVSTDSLAIGEVPLEGGHLEGRWGSHARIFEI